MQHWQALSGRRGVRCTKRARARALAVALRSAFEAMRMDKCREWVLNVGHQQGHVSGPLALYHRLGLLKSAPEGTRGAVSLAYGKWKRFQMILEELEKWIEMADEVGELGAPRTCKEWIAACSQLHDVVVKHKVKGMSGTCP